MRERKIFHVEIPNGIRPQRSPDWLKEVNRYVDEKGSLHQHFVLRGKRRFTPQETARRHCDGS